MFGTLVVEKAVELLPYVIVIMDNMRKIKVILRNWIAIKLHLAGQMPPHRNGMNDHIRLQKLPHEFKR